MVVGTLLLGHLLTGKVLGQRSGACSANDGIWLCFILSHPDDVAQVQTFEGGN